MSITIVPVTKRNLNLVAVAAAKFGMPRSVRWLERCLYDPTVEDLVDSDIRGHMAVREDGEVVAIQCYYYMPGYFRQKKFLMNTGCIMGADAKYGEELICCLDENRRTTNLGLLRVANCIASPRSAKITKVYNRMQEAPDVARCHYLAIVDCSDIIFWVLRRLNFTPNLLLWGIWCAMRPLAWVVNSIRFWGSKPKHFEIRECSSIDKHKFGLFWDEFLRCNSGIVTSREPGRLYWLFDESIRSGFVSILTAEIKDRIVGYLLLRRYPCASGPLSEFAIYDICAVNNNVECLRFLVVEAIRFAAKHKGARVSYSGALPLQEKWLNVVTWHRRIWHSYCTFFYKTRDKDIDACIKSGDGWFFGAFDGEKCLGHGRYIDT